MVFNYLVESNYSIFDEKFIRDKIPKMEAPVGGTRAKKAGAEAAAEEVEEKKPEVIF